jgi:hypothetical protein
MLKSHSMLSNKAIIIFYSTSYCNFIAFSDGVNSFYSSSKCMLHLIWGPDAKHFLIYSRSWAFKITMIQRCFQHCVWNHIRYIRQYNWTKSGLKIKTQESNFNCLSCESWMCHLTSMNSVSASVKWVLQGVGLLSRPVQRVLVDVWSLKKKKQFSKCSYPDLKERGTILLKHHYWML